MPGTKIPNNIIVASNSLLNKDYNLQGIQSYSLLGGIPAKFIRGDVFRLRDSDNERFLNNYFLKTKANHIDSNKLPVNEHSR